MASKAARKAKSTRAKVAKRTAKPAGKAATRPATRAVTMSGRPAAKANKAARRGKVSASKSRKARPTPRAARKASAPEAVSRYHTITPLLTVKSAQQAIEFYKLAFGAEERMRMPGPDGSIMHAELVIGDSTLMLSDAIQQPETRSTLHVYVDDCDSLYERAIAAGGRSKLAPTDMFWGDRFGQLEDPFGNLWSIATHKEDVAPDEMARRAAQETVIPTPPPMMPLAE
jgi:PhnB protein